MIEHFSKKVVNNEFINACTNILNKIDKNAKVYAQVPLFYETELFPVQIQYKNILFEAKNTEDLLSLLNAYVFFKRKRIKVFKDSSLFHIEINKKLKLSSQNINELKKNYNSYQNIRKSFPQINISNKTIDHRSIFQANFSNSRFLANQFEELNNELKLYQRRRKQISNYILKYEDDFSFKFEKTDDELGKNNFFVEYKNFLVRDCSFKTLMEKLKNSVKLFYDVKSIINDEFLILQTRNSKIFIIKYKKYEMIGDKNSLLKNFKTLIKYKTVQLSFDF